MRLVTASVLSMLACVPALADARLPVVNIAAGAVSARAAFGDVPVKSTPAVTVTPLARADKKSESSAPEKKKKTVVARASQPAKVTPVATTNTTSIDTGAEIAANNAPGDILSPRRPSGDLWAKMDSPLRLPQPQEFSVIRSDDALPEESLDKKPVRVAAARVATPAVTVAPKKSDEAAMASARSGALDAEIAKLVELQKKADESVRRAPVAPRIAAADIPAAPTRITARPAAQVAKKSEPTPAVADIADDSDDITISRMVVPMQQDVVVRQVTHSEEPRVAAVRDDLSRMSPSELKKAFKKTYLSENKHLSTFQIDDRFDVASDLTSTVEGFTAKRDLSEAGGVRPLEIKIRFRGDDSSLSRENYNLLSEYASIVVSNPKRAIQVSIPERVTRDMDDRKLAARRLAIVEQVLRDTGVSEQRIMPVLAQRDEDAYVLRIISSDQFETLTQKKRDMFGDTVGKKTYKNMTW